MTAAPPLRDSELMGRAAVVVLCGLAGLVGAARLCGIDVSNVIATFGGGITEYLWAGTLVVSAVLVTWAWLDPNEDRAALFEVVGLAAHVAATLVYLLAVFYTVPVTTEALFILAYMFAAIINCGGRAFLLARRMRWVRRTVL